MIDIESQVFTKIYNKLKIQMPKVTVDSVTNLSPTYFPYVSIEQTDSYAYRRTRTDNNNENHIVSVFEVNVFCSGDDKKSQAKKILGIIDDDFNEIGYTRYSAVPILLPDMKTLRMYARYQAVVSKNNQIYKR